MFPRFLDRLPHSAVPALLAALAAVWIAGCASPPKPPPPTVIKVNVEVIAGVNPDANGRPSPVVMKFFELKSLAAFESADFFSLFEKDKETLGAESVAREEIQLQPQENRKFERELQPDTRFIGVVAAFRDLERAKWRAALAVPAHKTTPVTIRIDARSVSLTAQ